LCVEPGASAKPGKQRVRLLAEHVVDDPRVNVLGVDLHVDGVFSGWRTHHATSCWLAATNGQP
jgi:hypothetical protein